MDVLFWRRIELLGLLENLICQSGVWRRSGIPTEAFALYGASQEYCYISNTQTSTCGCSSGKSAFFTGFSYAGATPYYWYYLCRG